VVLVVVELTQHTKDLLEVLAVVREQTSLTPMLLLLLVLQIKDLLEERQGHSQQLQSVGDQVVVELVQLDYSTHQQEFLGVVLVAMELALQLLAPLLVELVEVPEVLGTEA
jgi:hypothetical protein